METNTIVLLVGFVTIVLAIFASAWLDQRAFDRTLEQLEKRLEANFKTLDARFQAIDARFQTVEQRLDRIGRQLEQIFKPILSR